MRQAPPRPGAALGNAMNRPHDPFNRHDDPPRPSGGGGWLWFVIGALALILLIVWLADINPGALGGEDSKMRLVYLSLLLAMVASGVVGARRYRLSTVAKQAAAWIAIAAVLVVGYSLRDSLGIVKDRVLGDVMPSRGMTAENGDVVIRRSSGNHFYVDATVNGEAVRFLVDTGASDVVLTPADARRLHFDLSRLNFNHFYSTANGTGTGAPVRLDEVRIGPIVVRDVRASVNGAEMSNSLLGMSFLNRLSGYEVDRNTLILKR